MDALGYFVYTKNIDISCKMEFTLEMTQPDKTDYGFFNKIALPHKWDFTFETLPDCNPSNVNILGINSST